MSSRHFITAYWGPRQETPEACAGRYLRMLEALSTIDPVFNNWFFLGRERGTLLASLDHNDIAKLISEAIIREDDGTPFVQAGYMFGAANGLTRHPRFIHLGVHAGMYISADYYINTVDLDTEPLSAENADLISVRVMKPAMLAIAAAWDATWCGLRLGDLLKFNVKPKPWRPHFGLAWMTYLSPRFAPMIAPPPSAITEKLPGGGLLMIATEERFSVENPAHLAVARGIEAALAPVNALPWPPDG